MNQNQLETISPKILLIDTQEIFLCGTAKALNLRYPDAQILTAQTSKDALNKVLEFCPDLIIMDIYLSEKSSLGTQVNVGLQLLNNLLKNNPKLNFMVQSEHINILVQVKEEIESHQGGFIVANKNISTQEMLARVEWALQGITHIKEIKGILSKLEVKPEWLKLLNLAYKEGLQDKAIARHICVSERMVRHYWDKVQEVLEIDSEELKIQGKNIRIVTAIRAREQGWLE
ncbi:MAG: response regulator transcription factor [Calothrix sp. SM1_7_51]|nr:response regulator transcription factor [Calothrix sp. SM1_7_51]